MRLQFEDWVMEQPGISLRTEELFKESILCYRSKAYKGALLFSFLAFQNIIRERVLSASIPSSAEEHQTKWEEIKRKLISEDTSDAQVIEMIVMKRPFDIFFLSEDVRNQYVYWKNRRNDCAHGKENIIGSSHVESFWFFIESNLGKFHVEGGVSYLLKEVEKHFDIARTPLDRSPNYLVLKVPFAMQPIGLKSYLDQVQEIILKERRLFSFERENVIAFYQEHFTLSQEFIPELLTYFEENIQLLTTILLNDPSLAYQFKDRPDFIRTLWKTRMEQDYRNYKVVASLLQNGLIPETQFEEFVITITENNNDTYFADITDVTKDDFEIIINSDFIKVLGEIAFKVDVPKITSFDWARENKYLLCYYLRVYGFNEGTVEVLNSVFSKRNYPWRFGEELQSLFKDEPHLWETFELIADLNQIEICEYFKRQQVE